MEGGDLTNMGGPDQYGGGVCLPPPSYATAYSPKHLADFEYICDLPSPPHPQKKVPSHHPNRQIHLRNPARLLLLLKIDLTKSGMAY